MTIYIWPWEQPDSIKRSRDFLRDHICENYLVKAFKSVIKCIRCKKKL